MAARKKGEKRSEMVEILHLGDLIPDPKNAREHSSRNIGMIEASLRSVGAARSGVIDEGNVLHAGSGTYEALARAGIERVKVVESDGNEWVVVRRRGLSAEKKQELALYDNRTAELAKWNMAQLRMIQGQSPTVINAMWTADEMAAWRQNSSEEQEENPDQQEEPLVEGSDEERFLLYGREQIIDSALAWFRAQGFPYPAIPHFIGQQQLNKLAALPEQALLTSTVGNRIADTYHPHRYHVRIPGKWTPVETFDVDERLRKTIDQEIKYGPVGESLSLLTIASGTQGTSNFRPGFALSLYRRFGSPEGVIFDPCTGYGGRLVGFLASPNALYIGVDPCLKTFEGNLHLAEDYGASNRVQLINLPIEDVPLDSIRGRCDFSFTSPPYYQKEQYSDEPSQSWVRYKTAEDWRAGFLRPFFQAQLEALKPGGFAVINIADVKIGQHSFPLVQWSKEEAVSIGFELDHEESYQLGSNRFWSNEEGPSSEPVLFFRKPV